MATGLIGVGLFTMKLDEGRLPIDVEVKAARAWDHASDALTVAAQQAQSIHFSHQDVAWGLFRETWDAQMAAARYMYDRLVEGRDETDSIAKVLDHVAKVYQEQDQNFANVLIELEES